MTVKFRHPVGRLVPLALMLLLVLGSCSQVPGAMEQALDRSEAGEMGLAFSGAAPMAKMEAPAPIQQAGGDQGQIQPQSRKRIMRGEVDLRVGELQQAIDALSASVQSLGGHVASTSQYQRSATLVLRVPSEHFEGIFQKARSMGTVLRAASNVEDVTSQFTDLEGRIKSKRILFERYQSYLSQAKNVEDLLSIEAAVNNLTWEIEQLEASMKGLGDQIALATLTVNLDLPGMESRTDPDIRDAFDALGRNIGEFFTNLLMGLLYLVTIGVPLTLAVLLLWWLLFGKIGLLRKAFNLVSAPRKTPPESGKQ